MGYFSDPEQKPFCFAFRVFASTRNAKQVWGSWLTLLFLPPCLGAAEPVRLTSDGKLKFSPVFFNGGREIVYADLEKPEQYRLQRLNLATRAVEPLHPKATTSEFEPAVSADGKTYA